MDAFESSESTGKKPPNQDGGSTAGISTNMQPILDLIVGMIGLKATA
jgi:hypothetical protein